MKATKLVHPFHAREILSEQDAARLRAQGWLELADAKSVSKLASLQRLFRQRQLELGNRQLLVWLPGQIYLNLIALKKSKETIAQLIERLILLQNACGESDSEEHTK